MSIKDFFTKIGNAYHEGQVYSACLENRAWATRNEVSPERFYELRDTWQDYAEDLHRKPRSLLERAAFALGDESIVLSGNIPPRFRVWKIKNLVD